MWSFISKILLDILAGLIVEFVLDAIYNALGLKQRRQAASFA